MRKVRRVQGVAAPLPRADIDTDAMIPQRWLVTTTRDGLGAGLFGNWRYLDGSKTPDPEFVLNKPEYHDTKIIVAGPNYGCGSSREHAVWAHLEYGIEAVVAASFGPIFRDNALRNGLLTVSLAEAEISGLLNQLTAGDRLKISIDLQARRLIAPDGSMSTFAIDEASRAALLSGRDEIAATLDHEETIRDFQRRDRSARPFFWNYRGDL